MKINYQLETEKIIKSQDKKSSVFLHSCCAPCSSYVLQYLLQHFDVDLFFFNPNIQPQSEYELRLQNQEKLIANMCPEVKLFTAKYDDKPFLSAVRGLENEPEGGSRCSVCFRLRLLETAKLAKANGYDFFASTLTVSPHKNSQIINQIGAEIAEEVGIAWLPSDFKKKNGYKISIELAKNFELYRQEYCGCFYSISPPVE